MNVRLLSLLLITLCVLTGCSKKETDSWNYETQVPAVSVYPRNYQFSQTWHNTENGGAALRSAAYQHAMVSPYARKDNTFIKIPGIKKTVHRKNHSVKQPDVKAVKSGTAVLAKKSTQPVKPAKASASRKIPEKTGTLCACPKDETDVKPETGAGNKQKSKTETKSQRSKK